jgi:hypothetical protein
MALADSMACILGQAGALYAEPFTSGSVVIHRIGDGVVGLLATCVAVFLDGYSSVGLLVQFITLQQASCRVRRRELERFAPRDCGQCHLMRESFELTRE